MRTEVKTSVSVLVLEVELKLSNKGKKKKERAKKNPCNLIIAEEELMLEVHHGQPCAVECQDVRLQAEGQEKQDLGRASPANGQDS
jgi:hypothetical protein